MAQILDDVLKNEDYIGPRLCGFCQKEGFDFPVCSRCKVIAYCSSKCRNDNERTHERECQSTVDSRMKEIQKKADTKLYSNGTNNQSSASTKGNNAKKKNGKKR